MNLKLLVYYFLLFFVGSMLYDQWKVFEATQHGISQRAAIESTPPLANTLSEAPAVNTLSAPAATTAATTMAKKAEIITTVDTDSLSASINTQGQIVAVRLHDYPASLGEQDPVTLLTDHAEDTSLDSYFVNASANQALHFTFKSSQPHVVSHDQSVQVMVTAMADDLEVQRTFTFYPDRYVIDQHDRIINHQGHDLNLFHVNAISGDMSAANQHMLRTYSGAAYYLPSAPYTKLPPKKITQKGVNRLVQGGWVAVQQPYFIVSSIGDPQQNYKLTSQVYDGRYVLNQSTLMQTVKPGQAMDFEHQVYAGPEITKLLKPLAPGLGLTIDYGFLWPVSDLLFNILNTINQYLVSNWGVCIILLTIMIKLLFFTLSDKSYRSMAKLRKLQPRIALLQEQYKDKKEDLAKATMALYREEKVNPVGGCLPQLIQIPFFIALYWVLVESVQLRLAPFALWIQDLSVKDPYYILPGLMMISMLIQQQLTPIPTKDESQKIMMKYAMPVFMSFLLSSLPAGCILYWLTNNCFSIIHQWTVTRRTHA